LLSIHAVSPHPLAMVDVALTPAAAREAELSIVIDVLRAASTIVQALDAGYRRVLCVPELDAARALAAPGRVLAGERLCVRPPGFALGNSPADMLCPRAEDLVFTTTNGTRAIARAAELSPVVLIAGLLNLDAVIAAAEGHDSVQIVCAGVVGRPALDDAYVAGRIVTRLEGRASDTALAACAIAAAYPSAYDALAASTSARTLRATGLAEDVEWCARESAIDCVPRVEGLDRGIAFIKISQSILAKAS
jgi:2-phosphosulfolactate phosphatase